MTSASSAAVGGGSVQAWTQNLIELARHHSPPCAALPFLIQRVSDDKNVTDEFLKLVGCQDEDSYITSAKWSNFFRKMAVKMDVSDSDSERSLHMAIDAVRQHT